MNSFKDGGAKVTSPMKRIIRSNINEGRNSRFTGELSCRSCRTSITIALMGLVVKMGQMDKMLMARMVLRQMGSLMRGVRSKVSNSTF